MIKNFSSEQKNYTLRWPSSILFYTFSFKSEHPNLIFHIGFKTHAKMHPSKNAENQMNMVKFKNEFKPLLRSKYPTSRRECLEDKSGTGGQAIVEMPVFKKGQKEQAVILSGNKQTREMSEEERARHEAAIAEGRARRERAKQAQQEQIRGGMNWRFPL